MRINKNYLLRCVCLSVVGAIVVLTFSYFQSAQDEAGPVGEVQDNVANAEMPTIASSGYDINDILQQWSSGQEDEAIEKFLQLYDDKAPQSKYRPFDISELRFAVKSGAVRKKMQLEMEARFIILKKFNQNMQSQAKAAIAAGDNAKARQILLALKQLGQANTGTKVTLLAGLFGKMIESQADKELAVLGEAQNGGTPPP